MANIITQVFQHTVEWLDLKLLTFRGSIYGGYQSAQL